jgi:hypothetical protein
MNVFVGIVDGAVAAAVVAGSISEARAMMQVEDVIKMTSKTNMFVTTPQLSPRKKLLMSGATKSNPRASLPVPKVYAANGCIEFFVAVYVDDKPVSDAYYLRFPTVPAAGSPYEICK